MKQIIQIIQLLRDHPGTYGVDCTYIERWWKQESNAGESISEFLVRQGVLAPAAETLLELLANGYIRNLSAEILLTPEGPQRLRQALSRFTWEELQLAKIDTPSQFGETSLNLQRPIQGSSVSKQEISSPSSLERGSGTERRDSMEQSLYDLVEQQGAIAPLRATELLRSYLELVHAAHLQQRTLGVLRPYLIRVLPDDSLRLTTLADLSPVPLRAAAGETPWMTTPDAQNDLFNAGRLYQWLLTGGLALSVDTMPDVCVTFIARATHKQPKERFRTVREMFVALETVAKTLRGPIPATHAPHPAVVSQSPAEPANEPKPTVATAATPGQAPLPPAVPTASPQVASPPVVTAGSAADDHKPTAMLPSMPLLSLPTPKPHPQIGDQLGRCLITDQIGQGGFGAVYRAIHKSLKIPVAVKVILPSDAQDSSATRQLFSEARLLAQMNHPHIVRVLDLEDEGEIPYLVMEYVEGTNLHEMLQCVGRIQPLQAVQIMLQITEALIAAEKLRIVHRDIKPGNILISKDGTAKLADLGLAIRTNDATGTVPLAGTAHYMAPEQGMNTGKIDHRADIYALGVTFYQAVTGHLPFEGETTIDVMLKHLQDRVVPPHHVNPSVPPPVSRVILKMMEKKPEDRYANGEELKAALQDLLTQLQDKESANEKSTTGSSTHTTLTETQTLTKSSIWRRIFRK